MMKTHENCGGSLKVIETRHDGAETYRQKRCKKCGKLVYTLEFEIEYDEQVDAIWKSIMRKHRKEQSDG